MLAGHADRDRAVDVLRSAYAEGRLTKAEYDDRTSRVLNSRTLEELRDLTHDVPYGFGAPTASPAPVQPSHPAHQLPVPQGFGPAPMLNVPAVRPTNSTAVSSLVCALVSPFTFGVSAIPAVILGHKARGEIKLSGEQGDGQALTGLIIGWMVLGFLAMVLFGTAI